MIVKSGQRNPSTWWISSQHLMRRVKRAPFSALNASLEGFDRKTLQDERIECICRILWHGRDVLAVVPTGFGKSVIISVYSKSFVLYGPYSQLHIRTAIAVAIPLNYIQNQQVASTEKMDRRIFWGINQRRQRDREWKVWVQFGFIHQTKVLQVENKNSSSTHWNYRFYVLLLSNLSIILFAAKFEAFPMINH